MKSLILFIAALSPCIGCSVITGLISLGDDLEAATPQYISFAFVTPDTLEAEIENLPKETGLQSRGKHGITPLMVAAVINPDPEVINLLIKFGAELEDKDPDGLTALMLAARYTENPEVISVLIKAGANTNARDKEGKTALDYAKENKCVYETKAYEELNDAFNNQQ